VTRRALLACLGISLLAGCGLAPTTLSTAHATQRMQGKQLSVFEAAAAIQMDETLFGMGQVMSGLPAMATAPSDVVQQRALQNLYNADIAATLPQVDADIDGDIAASNIRSFENEYPPVTDPALVDYVQGISDRLTKAAHVAPFKVHLVNCPMVNAFNAGGHSMVVFTGILPTLKDEAELAGVMAHEMTHGLKRHMVQGVVTKLASKHAGDWVEKQNNAPAAEVNLAISYISTLPPAQQNDWDSIMGYLQGKVGAATMADMKFDMNNYFASRTLTRSHEAEADTGGARMLNAAGYDPSAMADVFDAWNSRPDGDTRYYDHPALGQRVAALRAQIQAEHLQNSTMDRGADRYAAAVAKAPTSQATAANVPKGVVGDLCF